MVRRRLNFTGRPIEVPWYHENAHARRMSPAWSWLVLGTGVLAAAAAGCRKGAPGSPGDLLAIEVSGTQTQSAEAFNEEVAAADRQGQPWAKDPVQVASRFLDSALARDSVWVVTGSGERPTRYHIVVVNDGLPGDSLRGRRYDLTIARAQGGEWKMSDVHSSWRCWRARFDTFGIVPCP